MNDDIKALYALGYFEDVFVDWQEETGVLKFILKEKSRVRKLEFKGNEKMSKGKFRVTMKQRIFGADNQESTRIIFFTSVEMKTSGRWLIPGHVVQIQRSTTTVVLSTVPNKKLI